MFSVKIGGITCRLSLLFPAVLLFLLWWDPSGLVLFGFVAAMLHELGHGLMCIVLHHKPRELMISFFGMRLTWSDGYRLSYRDEGLIALSGPLMNIACAGILHALNMPRPYILFHLALAVVNLLPIAPLDGERVAFALLGSVGFSQDRIKAILRVVSQGCFLMLVLLGVAVCMHSGHNATLLLFALYVGFLMLFHKGN